MLLNYIKLAIRLLLRNPFFTFINIFGLALGFAAFMVLWQYTTNELKTDQFHDDFRNKVRLAFSWKTRDNRGTVNEANIGLFNPMFPPALASEHEEFGKYTRVYQQAHFSLTDIEDHGAEIFLSAVNGNPQPEVFRENNLAYADPNFFEFFSIPLVHGNSESVLTDPASIVLSESMARKYFGGDVENKYLILNNSIELKVTGVFKDLPHHTHLQFDALLSTARITRQFETTIEGEGVAIYFHLKSGQDLARLGEQVDASAKKFLAPAMAMLNLNPDDLKFSLQPLEQVAFSKFRGHLHQLRSRTLLVALRIASVAILITAWINYLNLVIYANSKRTKELGVRRTSGAGSSDFVVQFTVESIIINALSIVGAVTLVQIARLPLQDFFQVYLSSGGVSVNTILIMVLITISGIVTTGVYPAFVVKNKPATTIFTKGYRHSFQLGRWLTALQFSVAIIMMISVSAMQSQLSYILNRDLGLRRDEVVVMDLPENAASYTQSNLDVFLNRLATLNGVTSYAVSSSVPGDNLPNGVGLQLTTGSEFIGTDTNGGIDERFLPFFDIKLLAGRNFVNDDPSNENAIIVSKNVLRRLGIDNPEDAIGLTILAESKAWTHNMAPAEIIGVIEDYYRKPLLSGSVGWANEDGVCLTYHNNVDAENVPQKVSFLINHHTFEETLRQVKTVYEQSFSNSVFHWYFLEDNVNRHYQQEGIARNQIMLFSALVVVIACLGLLGVVSNRAEEKTKEIGIRKVLGARMDHIARLLLKTTINQNRNRHSHWDSGCSSVCTGIHGKILGTRTYRAMALCPAGPGASNYSPRDDSRNATESGKREPGGLSSLRIKTNFMLLNYIKLSLRLLARNPFFAVLNIAGLSVGFAVFFVLWQYSSSELESDQQWKDWERIARIGMLWEWSDHGVNWESERYGVIAGQLGPELADDFPEVHSYTRILSQPNFNKQAAGLDPDIVMSYEGPDQTRVMFRQDRIAMTDPNFLTFFTIPLIAGTPSTALTNSNSLVISASIARKYFGGANPLGRIVTLNAQTFIVTGVFPDLPANTHLNFDILLSNTAAQINNWMALTQRPAITTYIKMKSLPDWNSFESKINDPLVIDRYFGETLKFFTHTRIGLLIQPLPEVRFSQMWIGDQFTPRSKNLLNIFKTIGLVVLLLAIVNYISLNASRMSRRLKEIGARKVSGAGLKDLIVQFLIESALVFALSVALAFTIIQGLRTLLQEAVRIPLTTPSAATMLLFTSIIVVSVGITAGYPVYMSIISRPQSLFAKKLTKGESKFTPFATLQFCAAIVLTIWGFMIYKQISFVISQDLGFSKNGVIVITPPAMRSDNFESDMRAFTQTLSTIPQIEQISRCHTVMGDAVNAFLVRKPGHNIPVGLDTNGGVDEAFLPFYDIPLLAGRNFLSSDRGNEIILSDGALSRLGFQDPADAIGANIEIAIESGESVAWEPATIIGVIKGYRLRPMLKFSSDHDNKADGGIALTYKSHLLPRLAAEKTVIRVSSINLDQTIQKVSDAFIQLFPGNVFHWYFLDENISRHYANQKVLRNQVFVFTCITIGIACLGLLGMITNKVVEKTKEIGIRKVLGAQLYQIANVLLSTTMKQIALATVSGIPVAYYITQRYLENFSNRVIVAWWHFGIPIIVLMVIMSCTVASAVWKAANGNPVEALKHE